MNQSLDKKIVEYLKRNRDQFIGDLQTLVSYNSVKADASENKPFGTITADLLDEMMYLCGEAGLETTNYDYYCMDAEYGQGDVVVASLNHLDIVPAGDGWTSDPFKGTMVGNLMYGRGVSDNKGPALASLYALKSLIDADVTFKRKIKLIYGCDEETGMTDMEYYLSKVKAPDFAFSPDASFPLIYAEKHGINGTYRAEIPGYSSLISMKAGIAVNSVPAVATAVVRSSECPESTEKVKYEQIGETLTVTAYGAAAHASLPQEGENAVIILINALLPLLKKEDGAGALLKSMADHLTDYEGSDLGIACSDEPSGALTMNLGIVSCSDSILTLHIDIRHPVTLDCQETMDKLVHALPLFTLSEIDMHKGVYRPKDSVLVKTLLQVYRDITKDNREPLAIGGGTYARTLPNAVAFGATFSGSRSGGAHDCDEHCDIDELLDAARVYAHSFFTLGEGEYGE